MSQTRLTKIVASILIFATLLMTSPAPVLAVSPTPTASTSPAPSTTPPPVTTPTPPVATNPPGTNPPAANDPNSFICAGRLVSSVQQIINLFKNPIGKYFEESLCLAIVVASLVAGNFACWLILTFIDPIFSPTANRGPTCTPDQGLTNNPGNTIPSAAPSVSPSSSARPSTTPTTSPRPTVTPTPAPTVSVHGPTDI